MLTRDEFRTLAEKVFSLSDAAEVEVLLTDGRNELTRFSNNAITQNVGSREGAITVRTVSEGKVGKAAVNRFDDDSLARAVKAAEAVMAHARPDPWYVPMQGPTSYTLAHPRRYEATASFGPADRAAVVSECVALCREAGCEAAGIVSNGESVLGLANDKGLFLYESFTDFEFSLTVEGDDVSGWSEVNVRDVSAADLPACMAEAVDIWKRGRSPAEAEPGRYTVILPPAALADIVLFLGWVGFTPIGYHEGTSPLSGKIGERIFGENITLTDDAEHPLSLGLPFDFEGTPRSRVTLVENGVMRNVVYDNRSAARFGAVSTGHALPQPNSIGAFPANIVMEGGDSSLEELVRTTERGILVTHLHYTNMVKPSDRTVTGMTRDGVFLVENGEIVRPLRNMRFTDSIFRVLNNVTGISAERRRVSAFFGGGFVLPAVRVEGFNFTSATGF
jgi:predicted Zn-dependent protease